MKGEEYLAGVGEAAVKIVLVDPVLEVTDPEGSDLFEGGRLVVAVGRGRDAGGAGGSGGPSLVVVSLNPLLLGRRIHAVLHSGLWRPTTRHTGCHFKRNGLYKPIRAKIGRFL